MELYTLEDIAKLKEFQEKIRSCPICQGSDLSCDCYKHYKFYNSLVASAIPTKYRDATLEQLTEPQIKPSVLKVRAYINDIDEQKRQGKGLYLYGNTGSGKTVIGSCVLKAALLKNYTAFFCTVEQYKASIFNKDEEYLYCMREYDFVLIDDYGREYSDQKGFIDSQVDDLLRYRSDRMKSTIITSNTESINVFNLRIKSILAEHFTEVLFKCADFRKNKIKKGAITHHEK